LEGHGFVQLIRK